KEVLFINADREYKEGKNQNKLRPEDIAKISYVYRKKEQLPGYSKLINKADLEKEDFNFNIRRYVDNSPPAEPHDVHAHLYGGIPNEEVESLNGFWANYASIQSSLFTTLKSGYSKFDDAIDGKEDIKEVVNNHADIKAKQEAHTKAVNQWWKSNIAKLEALPQNKNVFELYRDFSKSIATDFSALGILDLHKSRGAFAAYWNSLEADLKSVSASGWNAELIPEDEILQSQFPEVLEELSNNEARRDELDALFAEVNELEEGEFDEENYEVFPKEIIKEHKANIKEINGSLKGLKKEIKALNIRIKANGGDAALTAEVEEKESEVTLLTKQKAEIENKLARHAELE